MVNEMIMVNEMVNELLHAEARVMGFCYTHNHINSRDVAFNNRRNVALKCYVNISVLVTLFHSYNYLFLHKLQRVIHRCNMCFHMCRSLHLYCCHFCRPTSYFFELSDTSVYRH